MEYISRLYTDLGYYKDLNEKYLDTNKLVFLSEKLTEIQLRSISNQADKFGMAAVRSKVFSLQKRYEEAHEFTFNKFYSPFNLSRLITDVNQLRASIVGRQFLNLFNTFDKDLRKGGTKKEMKECMSGMRDAVFSDIRKELKKIYDYEFKQVYDEKLREDILKEVF